MYDTHDALYQKQYTSFFPPTKTGLISIFWYYSQATDSGIYSPLVS